MLSKTEWILREVAHERERQQEKFGYTPEQDDGWRQNELTEAACYMAWPEDPVSLVVTDDSIVEIRASDMFPEASWDVDIHTWRDRPYRERLVIAAALLVAEIERLDRM